MLSGSRFSQCHNKRAALAKPSCQAGIIAVAGYEAKTANGAGVKNVHRIDYHGAVRCVLPNGVAKLLYGLNGVLLQAVLPAVHVRGCPLSIDAADSDSPIFARFRQDLLNKYRLGIVGIDQHRHGPVCI